MFVSSFGTQAPGQWTLTDPSAYSYLLGIYLGDGYLAMPSAQCRVLEISLDPRYPGIVEECSKAVYQVANVRPRVSRRTTPRGEAIRLVATSRIWHLAFPQHGPGKKHERAITLQDWQRVVTTDFPRPFLRGLIHSDGSRVINRFSVDLAEGAHTYAYPRYFFTNLSVDIQAIFCTTCDQLGIRWTQSSDDKNISIAHRKSVALLDAFVGPKA